MEYQICIKSETASQENTRVLYILGMLLLVLFCFGLVFCSFIFPSSSCSSASVKFYCRTSCSQLVIHWGMKNVCSRLAIVVH